MKLAPVSVGVFARVAPLQLLSVAWLAVGIAVAQQAGLERSRFDREASASVNMLAAHAVAGLGQHLFDDNVAIVPTDLATSLMLVHTESGLREALGGMARNDRLLLKGLAKHLRVVRGTLLPQVAGKSGRCGAMLFAVRGVTGASLGVLDRAGAIGIEPCYVSDGNSIRARVVEHLAYLGLDKRVGAFEVPKKCDVVAVMTFEARYNWKAPFNKKDTIRGPFEVRSGKHVTATFMRTTAAMDYGEDDSAQYLRQALEPSGLCVDYVLPRSHLNAIEMQQLAVKVVGGAAHLDVPVVRRKVAIMLPSVGFESQMGVADVAKRVAGGGIPYVSGGHHVEFRMDERGLGATSVSYALAGPSAAQTPTVLRFTRPYIVVVRHIDSGLCVVVAVVRDPSEGAGDAGTPAQSDR